MNNESGSALQKANFVLLALILAGIAYLIVRDRIRSEQRAAEAQAAQAAATQARAMSATTPGGNALEMKSSFTPLRDRVQPNATRVVSVVTNRVSVVLRTNFPAAGFADSQPDALLASPAGTSLLPVPVAVGSGRAVVGTQKGPVVAGRVSLRGTPPPEITAPADAGCGALAATVTTRHYVVSADQGLANVFVYVKEGARPTPAPQRRGVLLDQLACQYQPYVAGVQVRQHFDVQNSDPIMHNVHPSPTKLWKNPKNPAQPVKGMKSDFVFDSPEVFVQFKCDVHPKMFAYVGVVDHPWFAVTDSNGNFALPPGLPPGQYTLAAVHRKAGELLQQINVGKDGTAPADFTFDVPGGLAKASPP